MHWIVNADDVEALCAKVRIFRLVRQKYGIPPNWKRAPGFISLCRIILEQQVSLESAKAHFNRLSDYLPEFSPREILKLSDLEMRECQISRQKAKYLRELAMAVLGKDIVFEDLKALSDIEVKAVLTRIKGIGNWTADIYSMFCLQRKDIFPIGDIAVINAARQLLNVETKEEVIKKSEKWKPYRSLAAYFLWHHYLMSRNR
jgi:DNA-3-methyladenine glycosylase II